MKTIANRLQTVYQAIQDYQKQHSISRAIQLVAVSKTKPVNAIEQAYQAGQRAFGENYVQEGVDKIAQLTHLDDIEWHFIGPLQSNKTKLIAAHFDWMHSVDRGKIAQRLNDQRPPERGPLNVLIQVNISRESSKSGCQPDDVMTLVKQIDCLPSLRLRGLMCIGSPDKQASITEFQHMQALFEQLSSQFPHLDTLSMGMSDDWQTAVSHGSTMIRLGSAIFGQRNVEE